MMPDIDIDGDGLEAFCDSNPDDENQVVDVCIDGDGTMYVDADGKQCTAERDADDNLRFVDGVSMVMNFETVPAMLREE
jgi:hypothetical protein